MPWPNIYFLVGVIATACEREEIDTAGMDLRQTVGLLTSDLSELRHFETLLKRLGEFDQGEVAQALMAALDLERNAYGGVGVARVMGRLGLTRFAAPLVDSICKECCDFLCESANPSSGQENLFETI